MVRYYEIIQEDDKVEQYVERKRNMMKLLSTSYKIEPYHRITLVNDEIDCFRGALKTKEHISDLPNVMINEITGDFIIENTNLKNLLYSPIIVRGSVKITNNNLLESLEGLPKVIDVILDIGEGNNNLKSLKGIDEKSKIDTCYFTYNLNLPLLRLMYITDDVYLYNSDEHVELMPILNNHIQDYKNINERILRCKIALTHAGYESNARLD